MKSIKRTKTINTSLVIRELWLNRAFSRIEIARTLGLNKSTVTHIINELIEIKLVKEGSEGEASPQGGRRPVFLSLNKDFGSVIGIEVRPESYTVVSVDLDGNVRFFRTKSRSVDSKNLTDSFLGIIRDAIEEQEKSGVPLLGIGIGLSGMVNPSTGHIKFSIPLEIHEIYDFKKQIAANFDIPVFVENDANCCSWGELAFHRTRELQNFLFILVEFRNIESPRPYLEKTAVGLGIVIDGKVHYGKNHSAGEFRSVFLKKTGGGQFSLNLQEESRIDKDPRVLEKFVRELSKNIALFVNSFNLSQVFLGGDIENYQDIVSKILQEEIQNNWPYPGSADCEIRFSSLGDMAVAYGAAGMILDRLFSDPEYIIRDDVIHRHKKHV